MTYIKTPFPIGKMGKWENGKNVIKTQVSDLEFKPFEHTL